MSQSIPNRVPAGVKTGGQFAVSMHAEPSDVALMAGEKPTPLGEALKTADEFRAMTARYSDRLNLAGTATYVRENYPAAARMAYRYERTGEYDAQPYTTIVHVADADGNVIDSFPNPYGDLNYRVPAHMEAESFGDENTWGYGWDEEYPDADPPRFIDLDAASRIDPAYEEQQFRDRVARAVAPF